MAIANPTNGDNTGSTIFAKMMNVMQRC